MSEWDDTTDVLVAGSATFKGAEPPNPPCQTNSPVYPAAPSTPKDTPRNEEASPSARRRSMTPRTKIAPKSREIWATFDLHVPILAMIEHFQPNEVNELVNLLMSKLGENGKLILTTPNYSGIWLFLEKIVSIVGPVNYKYQHINRYTKNRILKQFTEYGVEVKKYINFGIFFSIFSTDLGIFMNKLISKIFFNFFGYSLIITIYKSKK